MTILRTFWDRVSQKIAARRARGQVSGSDFGARLDATRNEAARRGDTTQQGPTWGGGPF